MVVVVAVVVVQATMEEEELELVEERRWGWARMRTRRGALGRHPHRFLLHSLSQLVRRELELEQERDCSKCAMRPTMIQGASLQVSLMDEAEQYRQSRISSLWTRSMLCCRRALLC